MAAVVVVALAGYSSTAQGPPMAPAVPSTAPVLLTSEDKFYNDVLDTPGVQVTASRSVKVTAADGCSPTRHPESTAALLKGARSTGLRVAPRPVQPPPPAQPRRPVVRADRPR